MAVRDVPSVRFGMLVSGSSVIADEDVVRDILQRHPTAIGLDMEMFGLFTAVDRCFGRRPSVLGIKGVADFGHRYVHPGSADVTREKVERFTFAGAAHRPLRRDSAAGSAPVNVKRLELNRSPDRRAYGC